LTFSSSPPEHTSARKRRASRPYRPRELREAGVSPAKALGQHFLTDWRVTNRILTAAALTGEEVVIEVGPGMGALTEKLQQQAGHVVAVELDRALCQHLREKFGAAGNVSIVEGDVLKLDPGRLLADFGLGSEYAVVGNLPYNIGIAILRRFLEASLQPRWLIAMLQKEVADSIVAGPGKLSIVGVAVQVYADPRRLFNVPPAAFYPPPRVHSAVIRLDVRPEPLVPAEERVWFFEVVRAGFSAPRKQLRNTLANGLGRPPAQVQAAIVRAGLEPTLRPQDLSVPDWLRLARAMGS
jgi:16S rRNA (adenine1518-N6/adenine1519-N6)-dimethyltransferase